MSASCPFFRFLFQSNLKIANNVFILTIIYKKVNTNYVKIMRYDVKQIVNIL